MVLQELGGGEVRREGRRGERVLQELGAGGERVLQELGRGGGREGAAGVGGRRGCCMVW